jgi:hypothetical protein
VLTWQVVMKRAQEGNPGRRGASSAPKRSGEPGSRRSSSTSLGNTALGARSAPRCAATSSCGRPSRKTGSA